MVKRVFAGIIMLAPICAHGGQIMALDDAIGIVRDTCVGISAKMSHMKTLAGINTAVTGVGTAAGVGATVSGLAKNNLDKQIDKIQEIIERYKTAKSQVDNSRLANVRFDDDALRRQLRDALSTADVENKVVSNAYSVQIDNLESARDMGIAQSKKLGNVRTGLMATGTATSIAGTLIAANNGVSDNLKTKITECLAAIDILRDAKMQARIDGADTADIARADAIINACGKYAYAGFDKINNHAKGAGISSGVGAATGLGGTITSAVANTDKARDGDNGREKGLNTAANVMAGVTSVASLTATVFNAAQIKAIKNVSEIADECEGVLK